MRLRLRRLWRRLSEPVAQWRRKRRARRGRRSVERTRTWRHSTPLVTAARIATTLAAVVFVLWVVRALVVVIRSDSHGVPFDLETACGDTGFSCAALSGTLVPIFSIALASAVFLCYRLWQVHRAS